VKLQDSKFYRLYKMALSIVKFGLSSALGTLVDFVLFTFVFLNFFPLFYAELSAALCGMTVNYFMHRYFVFEMQRKAYAAFFLSIAFSLMVMMFGGYLLTFLASFSFFATYIIAAKLIVMGVKFGLNYLSKRWIFEKKMFRE